jgi:predicted SprT family Zn-dependent metalloprotease
MKLEQIIQTQQIAKKLLSVKWNGDDEPSLSELGWTFRLSNRKRAVGTCIHDEKVIEVSKYYIESHPDEIEDTIRHEIAHALVGPGHGHDYVWRRKCVEVGANPTRTTDQAVFGGQYNYTVGCNNDDCTHHWEAGKHRLKQAYMRYHCKWCKGPLFVYNHKTGEIMYTTPDPSWAEA